MLLTFYTYQSVPWPQKEGPHRGTRSKGHQDSRYPHLHHALHSPLLGTTKVLVEYKLVVYHVSYVKQLSTCNIYAIAN
jgi:hypothetical protein